MKKQHFRFALVLGAALAGPTSGCSKSADTPPSTAASPSAPSPSASTAPASPSTTAATGGAGTGVAASVVGSPADIRPENAEQVAAALEQEIAADAADEDRE
jgi:hypothetical protein